MYRIYLEYRVSWIGGCCAADRSLAALGSGYGYGGSGFVLMV
ncbi:hypothetical protein C4K14_3812 [Pseudomonas chlororaphis subsp. aureofaciens]|nr:hypothetical protein C4K14_3812 [Pseudomonas chlororaphis subsp. aureofaciens]